MIDRERIDSICRGDDALAIDLIAMLVDEAEPIVTSLDECLKSYDMLQANQLAHALKGIAGNVGAFELRDAATRLETVSGKNQAPTSIALDAEMIAIARAFDRVRATHSAWKIRSAGNAGIFS